MTHALDEIRTLARLAVPLAAAQMGIVTMGLVDTAIVGQISPEALGSVATGRSILHAAMSVSIGAAVALEPLTSQAVGANDPARAWRSLIAGVRALALLAPLTILVSLGMVALLGPFGVAPQIIPGARAYVLGHAPATFFFPLFIAGRTLLQAHGRTRATLAASVLANAINAAACSLFVLGDRALVRIGLPAIGLPALGPFGAGLAATLGSVVLAACVLIPVQAFRARTEAPAVPIRTVFALGLPVGLQTAAEIGVFSFAAVLAGKLGETPVAAHQVALGLASFTFMGALGVSGAAATRVGHAIGAGRSPVMPGVLGIALGVAVMSVGALAFALVPEVLVRLFTRDAAVAALGVRLVTIAALFQLFDGVQVVAAGALRGMGDVRFPFLANVLGHWGVGLPISLLLCFHLHMGAAGLWWGLTFGLIAVAIALALRFATVARRVAREHAPDVRQTPGGSGVLQPPA